MLAELQAEVEAQAALAAVAQHAEAGRRAQADRAQLGWAPPQMWSQPAEAPAPDASMIQVPVELLRVLDAVTSMCDHVIEYIEADRAERPLMIEALTRLNQSLSAPAIPAEPNGNGHGNAPAALDEHVIGGSMEAGPPPLIDLRQAETAVEVRCRFGDRWVDGFEICEVLHDESGVRYRLRRRVDSVVLPDLFDAAHIRHIETFEELTSTAPSPHPRYWSPL